MAVNIDSSIIDIDSYLSGLGTQISVGVDIDASEDLYVNSREELDALLIANGVAEADVVSTWDAIWPVLIDPDTGVEYASAAAADNQIYNQGGILKSVIVVAIPSGSPNADILAWELNETSGTSIAGTGTNGGDGGTTDGSWVSGESGNALEFNGSSQKAYSNSAITFGTNVITISFWLRSDTHVPATQVILETGTAFFNANGAFLVYLSGSNIRAVLATPGANYEDHYCVAPATGAFEHVAIVIDASASAVDMKFFVNGVQQSTTNPTSGNGPQSIASLALNVGSRNQSSLYLDGAIDDLRIYSGDQSANISSIMNDPK